MTHHITHASMTPTHGAAKHSTITMKYSNKMQKERKEGRKCDGADGADPLEPQPQPAER
jgi:hypothetical protein